MSYTQLTQGQRYQISGEKLNPRCLRRAKTARSLLQAKPIDNVHREPANVSCQPRPMWFMPATMLNKKFCPNRAERSRYDGR
jgi:hypothetical protein